MITWWTLYVSCLLSHVSYLMSPVSYCPWMIYIWWPHPGMWCSWWLTTMRTSWPSSSSSVAMWQTQGALTIPFFQIMFNTYLFAPRCRPDPEELMAKMAATELGLDSSDLSVTSFSKAISSFNKTKQKVFLPIFSPFCTLWLYWFVGCSLAIRNEKHGDNGQCETCVDRVYVLWVDLAGVD